MLTCILMPMLGAALVFIFCILSTGLGLWILCGLTSRLDAAAQFGLAGLVALGLVGTLTFFGGLANLHAATVLVAGAVVVGGLFGWSRILRGWPQSIARPQGFDILFPVAIGLALLMALAGVLAPSTSNDWDSLAYHLAVPKLWLEAGKVDVVPFIHQANFPFAVDSLFILGLKWGGQAGAKMFVWMTTFLGVITIFGLARQRYGQRAGWWASLVFSTVPIVLWLSGTAYIDVAHSLYAGLGLVFACLWLESDDAKDAWISAILLGLAAGTKYTGLQTIAVAGLVALIGAILLKRNLKPVFIIGLASLALGSPWYIKNLVWKENPVFPFFYGKLGGKEWDQRRAGIYTHEQNTFGVGRAKSAVGSLEPERFGHSVMGLAYQPGRFVNPQQDSGGGYPMGAVGFAVIGALMLGMVAGQRGNFERALLGGVLLSLGIWFVLTQQSRYIVTLAVPLALIAGQLTTRKGIAPLMMGLVGIQTLASLYLMYTLRFSDQMLAVTGKQSTEEYQARRIPFFIPAQEINKLGKDSKVALYDEVFGYVLDVPYYWANPGHSTQIPYDLMNSGVDFAARMKEMGFTHVLVNMIENNRADLNPGTGPILGDLMHAAIGGERFPEPYRGQLMSNWEVKFKVLISEAAGEGHMQVEQTFGSVDRPPRFILFKL